jgi:ABC-2 type transport system permease protein
MIPVIALAIKDLRHLVRDRGAAFFALGFPLLVALFFGFIFGGDASQRARLTVRVVNLDQGPAGASLVEAMRMDQSLDVAVSANEAEAIEAVRLGKAIAVATVPADFTQASALIFAGSAVSLRLVVDPSRHSEASLLEGKLNQLAFRLLAERFANPEWMRTALNESKRAVLASPDGSTPRSLVLSLMFDAVQRATDAGFSPGASEGGAWNPIRVGVSTLDSPWTGPRSGYEVSFIQGIIWGLMGCVTAFGSSMASERARGTLARLTVAPITRAHVLAGKSLACFIACLAVQAMLVTFGMAAFGIRVEQPLLLATACVAAGVGFTGLMMFMAGLTRTEGGGSGLGRAMVLVLAMIGGGTIPLFVMPRIMLAVSRISPFSWATTCLEGALWRGYSPQEMLAPAAILMAFGVVGFAIGVSALRWND